MSRKLLIEDYTELTKGAFKCNVQDFYNYYLNFINTHFKTNRDIIQQILKSITNWVDWFRDIVCKDVFWEVDENGNKTLMDREYQVSIPLDSYFGIRKHINKSFFDYQIDAVNAISKIIDYYNSLTELENLLDYETILEIQDFRQRSEFDLDLDTLGKKYELLKKALDKYGRGLIIDQSWIDDNKIDQSSLPKYSAKYYAVFHYLRSLNDDKYILIRNSDDKLKATELQLWFAELYPTISSQGIYRKLLSIKDSSNQLHSFLKNEMSGERKWKSKIREIATFFNDNKVITELDNY